MSEWNKAIFNFFIKIKAKIRTSKNKSNVLLIVISCLSLIGLIVLSIVKPSSAYNNILMILTYLLGIPIFFLMMRKLEQSAGWYKQILEQLNSVNFASLLQTKKELEEKRIEAESKLQKQRIDAKLQLKPLKHSFLVSLSMTIIGGLGFLGCVWLYCRFQDILIIKDVFVTKPEFHGIQNDFCKLALIVFSRAPIIVFFIVGLLICKRCFTWYDKYRDYLSLWEYHSRINDKDKQDDLLIALAPNYFGTKRNRRSDNNFMEKLLLKMIPTLNINAGGGSNNGNNGGQNGGQTH